MTISPRRHCVFLQRSVESSAMVFHLRIRGKFSSRLHRQECVVIYLQYYFLPSFHLHRMLIPDRLYFQLPNSWSTASPRSAKRAIQCELFHLVLLQTNISNRLIVLFVLMWFLSFCFNSYTIIPAKQHWYIYLNLLLFMEDIWTFASHVTVPENSVLPSKYCNAYIWSYHSFPEVPLIVYWCYLLIWVFNGSYIEESEA